MNFEPLPVGVIGCGRMGRLHARVYSQMPRVKLVGVYHASADAAEATARDYNTIAFASAGELLDNVKAATIAVPTVHHLAVAKEALSRKVACLIEKPLAPDVAQAQQIVQLAKSSGAVVQVGHIERFNPAVRAMSRLGIKPRFIEVTRISPLTFRSIDVGVVLDMMIHDIDIVLSLAESEVESIHAVGVSVLGDAEDVCNARITFKSGVVANLTASRLALKTERRLRVFSPDAYVSLDYQKKYGMVARRSGNVAAIQDAARRIKAGEVQDLSDLNYADLVQVEELQIDDVEPLRGQLENFVDAATGAGKPAVSAEDGLAAVDLAARIVAAMPKQTVSGH